MQSISYAESRKPARSSIGKRALTALAVLLLALSVNATDVDTANSQILKGALIGGGIGAIFGGGRGAVAGAIAGGVLGALSKPRYGKRRRW
jgi:outer membrane lipoprotein SlyB